MFGILKVSINKVYEIYKKLFDIGKNVLINHKDTKINGLINQLKKSG